MDKKRIIALCACTVCLNGGLSSASQAVADSAYTELFGQLDSLAKPRKRPVHKIMNTFVHAYNPDLMELQDKLMSYKAGIWGTPKDDDKGKRPVDKWYRYVSFYITSHFEVPTREAELAFKPSKALFMKVPEFFEEDK